MSQDKPSPSRGVARGDTTSWWGVLDVPRERTFALEVGPLSLEIERRAHEWRLRHREESSASDDRLTRGLVESREVDLPPDAASDSRKLEGSGWDRILRIGAESASAPLEAVALTADRPVVTVPVNPFLIPPRASLLLFVSTPLWLGIEREGERLFEVPISRPRDTWVGAQTGPGQAAYANRTQCRQDLEELPFRPHRAVSPIQVTNRSGDAFPLEHLVLSVPFLSLYQGKQGLIWTERIEVTIDAGIDSEIRFEAPAEAGQAHQISTRRSEPPSGRLGQMLASVF